MAAMEETDQPGEQLEGQGKIHTVSYEQDNDWLNYIFLKELCFVKHSMDVVLQKDLIAYQQKLCNNIENDVLSYFKEYMIRLHVIKPYFEVSKNYGINHNTNYDINKDAVY